MFDFIKTYLQRRQLRQLTDLPRRKKISNIADVHAIGILFTVGDKETWDALYDFARQQEKGDAKVWMIGYQAAGVSINYIFTHPRMVILHEKDDFTFAGTPKDTLADSFLQQRYDLLIDATQTTSFLSEYLSLRSTADLKVTYVDDNAAADPEKEKTFDLLIHGDKPMALRSYLPEIVRYLSMIKK